MARPKKTQLDFPYKALLKMSGKTFESKGISVYDVLTKLNVDTTHGRAILCIAHDDKKKEKVLAPIVSKRLFSSHGLYKDIIIRQLSSIFGNI